MAEFCCCSSSSLGRFGAAALGVGAARRRGHGPLRVSWSAVAGFTQRAAHRLLVQSAGQGLELLLAVIATELHMDEGVAAAHSSGHGAGDLAPCAVSTR